MKNLVTFAPSIGLLALSLSLSTSDLQADSLKGKPDPQMSAVLQSLRELKPKPIEKLSPRQARQQPLPSDAVKRLLKKQGRSLAPERVDSVVDKTVPGPNGPVTVRVYRPLNSGNQKLPVLVYFHGGGFVIASVSDYDSSARALANGSGAMVVSVAYRMAPEHKLPTAHEDSYAVTQYLAKNAGAWGGDSNRIAVGGESAGGNLATDMCLMAKMRGGKMPIHQLLVYPFVSAKNTPSRRAYYNAKPLNTPMLGWFVKHAVPPSLLKNPKTKPLVAPADFATTAMLRGLPPATIILAEIDPLQSEGYTYANKLKAAGVPVALQLYKGVTHEFFGMGAVVDKAKAANGFASNELRKSFGMR